MLDSWNRFTVVIAEPLVFRPERWDEVVRPDASEFVVKLVSVYQRLGHHESQPVGATGGEGYEVDIVVPGQLITDPSQQRVRIPNIPENTNVERTHIWYDLCEYI